MTPPKSSKSSRASRPSGDRYSSRPAPDERAPRPQDPRRVLARQPWTALLPLLPESSCEPEATLTALRGYALSLLEWNRGVSNLISRHDEDRLVERHLAESLHPAALMLASGCKRVLDLGSGAGLPAIPLAVAGVGKWWTLVESRRNKTLFMRKALEDLSLKNVDVSCSRLENLILEPEFTPVYDGFTSRATMAIGPTLELAHAALVPGGRAFLWKGSGYVDEMESTRKEWSPGWTFEAAHPILVGPNVVAVFVKI
jgi:16S rRNA (guanine527-N7)-methyltransferase